MKVTRTIYLVLEIDWEDYQDVHEQLILEDAIRETSDGVSIRVMTKEELEKIKLEK